VEAAMSNQLISPEWAYQELRRRLLGHDPIIDRYLDRLAEEMKRTPGYQLDLFEDMP
jgi:hypothetical protein